jgi:hypothetical protein
MASISWKDTFESFDVVSCGIMTGVTSFNVDANIVKKTEKRTVKTVAITSTILLCFCRILHRCPELRGGLSEGGKGLSMYSNNEVKMMIGPGMTKNFRCVPKRIGEMYKRIPVATAVERHLTTASASNIVSAGSDTVFTSRTYICTRLLLPVR